MFPIVRTKSNLAAMQTMQVALRTAADPERTVASVREAMRSVDADLPFAKVATLTALVDQSLTQPDSRCSS